MFEWLHIIIATVSLLAGALGGLITGVWRAARIEQSVRADFRKCIGETEKEIGERLKALAGQFRDTFTALREKINMVELRMVSEFVHENHLTEFRKEYREDMVNLMKKIDHITERADR